LYPFQPASYLHRSNIYCVNLRQYSQEGSFRAFQEALPRLKQMGVEILWFMPIYPIGKIRRKGSLGSYYSISDFRDTNPEFGTQEEFRELVTAIHTAGMKLILDWVANHAAWDNVWTVDHPEYFERDETGAFKPPYDWDDVIQIDHGNKAQQEAMTDAMLFWIKEFDIDGFRADLAHLTPLPFWINARQKASALKPDLVWLAETEEISYHQAFDISFTWQWMHDTEDYCKGKKPFENLLNTLLKYQEQFPTQALRMWFTSNHDENSWNGTAFEKYGPFVKALTVFNCTYPGIPLVYSGEESGLNKRLQFFDKDVINWDLPSEWELLYRALFQLRRSHPVFAEGAQPTLEILTEAAQKNMIAFKRAYQSAALLVIINLGGQPQYWELEARYSFVQVGAETPVVENGNTLLIPSGGYMILQVI
jgi:alpha-amylase